MDEQWPADTKRPAGSALPESPGGLPGTITIEEQSGAWLLCLAGEIDLAVVGEFEAHHGRLPQPVDVIDAGQVTFIGSTGVQFLLRWAQASTNAGQAPMLRRSAPVLDQVLRLTGLFHVLQRPTADTQ